MISTVQYDYKTHEFNGVIYRKPTCIFSHASRDLGLMGSRVDRKLMASEDE